VGKGKARGLKRGRKTTVKPQCASRKREDLLSVRELRDCDERTPGRKKKGRGTIGKESWAGHKIKN